MAAAASATAIIFDEQYEVLRRVAEARSWKLRMIDGPCFVLGLPGKGDVKVWLKVECDNFPTKPPAWHWYDIESGAVDRPEDTPRQSGGYLHSSGRICAPWNRLAYKEVDPKGPHGDWQLASWLTNPHTKACTTLAAMALRISQELKKP